MALREGKASCALCDWRNEWVCYLRDLTQTGDLASVGVYGEEHRSGLRGLRLQQLQ